MSHRPLASYLRTHRRKSGLTQHELARILGYAHGGPISRHELAADAPSFLAGLSYEAVFRISVSEMFPGIYEEIEKTIESRLAEFERDLTGRSATGADAKAIAQKLEWLWARKNGIELLR